MRPRLGRNGGLTQWDAVAQAAPYVPNAQCLLQLNPFSLQEVASFICILTTYVALVMRSELSEGNGAQIKAKASCPFFSLRRHKPAVWRQEGKSGGSTRADASPMESYLSFERLEGFF